MVAAAEAQRHFTESAGGWNAFVPTGSAVPGKAAPVYGMSVNVPLPALAVVVTVIKPVAGVIATDFTLLEAVGGL